MGKINMKPTELLSPIPAVMVSCGTGEEANIITIAWTGTVNSVPPMTYVSVMPKRHSHALIKKNGEFVINLVNTDLVKACDYCGVRSGANVNKWKEMNLTQIPGDIVSCPMIKESPVNLECKVVEVHEYNTHDMFVAEIVAIHVNEELMDAKGRLCMEKANLVAYTHGMYMPLHKRPVGTFGFSVMKPKTAKRKAGERRQASRMSQKKKGK